MGKIIGIDFGTTNSCVAVLEGGEPVVIANVEGDRTTPSVVGFSKDGELLLGKAAQRSAIAQPDRTVFAAKRDLSSNRKVYIDNEKYTPTEISAMILFKLKKDAEVYLDEPVTQAVISVPSCFTDAQRRAVIDAGKIAGLEVVRLINDTMATALAYGLDYKVDHKVLIFDLGGGTFDVSLLEIDDGVFEVIATAGDNRLGGNAFNQRVMDYLIKRFESDNGIDLSKDRMAMQRLGEAAVKAKIELTSEQTTTVNVPFIALRNETPLHMEYELTRDVFEEITEDLIAKTVERIEQVLHDSGYTESDVDKVILVGGSTHIPSVRKAIGRKFALNLLDNNGIDSDECVAMGAAIQGGVLSGEVKDVLLLDVTQYSLGIEKPDGQFVKLISRNAIIPTKKSLTFSTMFDKQSRTTVYVYQGEDAIATNNIFIGSFDIWNIPSAPAGEPQIKVTLAVDANGIVHISAQNQESDTDCRFSLMSSVSPIDQAMQKIAVVKQFIDFDSSFRDRLSKDRLEGLKKKIADTETAIASGISKKIMFAVGELCRGWSFVMNSTADAVIALLYNRITEFCDGIASCVESDKVSLKQERYNTAFNKEAGFFKRRKIEKELFDKEIVLNMNYRLLKSAGEQLEVAFDSGNYTKRKEAINNAVYQLNKYKTQFSKFYDNMYDEIFSIFVV